VFLALLVAGAGVAIRAGARPTEEAGRRVGLLAVSASVALAGLIGAIVVGVWSPGVRGREMMTGSGMAGMASMMSGSSKGACSFQTEGSSAVTIEGFQFCPVEINVKLDTVVRWTNRDSITHTVTPRGPVPFDSGNLSHGKLWRHRFDQAGTFRYYCEVHRWMQGSIEVTA